MRVSKAVEQVVGSVNEEPRTQAQNLQVRLNCMIDEWMNERTNGRTNKRLNERTNERMNERTNE